MAVFTWELLRTGCMLSDLASDLIEAIPPDAYPGEDPAAVVIEMMTGTIGTALADVETREIERATSLISWAADRVIEHLQLALELRRRMDAGPGDIPGRAYG